MRFDAMRRRAACPPSAIAIFTVALCAATVPVHAQSYPQRPVRIVVNVTAGGGVDTTARAVAQHLNSVFKQPFIVDNRTGAGGAIGIELVARANADGYTFLICSSGIVTNAAYKKQNYDPVRDFQPVSNLTSTPYLVAVTPAFAVKSIRELVALAKARPGVITYATSGVGSITHLGAALLPLLSETHMLSVPFKGVADAYPAVANGDVNWIIGAAISALPLVKAGRMRAIAITTQQRSKLLPDLPTVAETLPGYEVVGWFGMFAPAGTPMALIEKVNAETRRGLLRPDFARMVEAQGAEIIASTPAELAGVVKNEVQIWQKVVRNLN